MFSGGVASWATARIVADEHGTDGLVLLFADTLMEDEDLYRFLDDAAADIGVPVTTIRVGMNPWQVFEAERFIGNSRADPCSKNLKRVPMREWLERECLPFDTTVYLGISHDERQRLDKGRKFWSPYFVEAPLCDPPYHDKCELLSWLQERGIATPRLYAMGFGHNNCGGFCVKAGQGQFYRLLTTMPERYAWHESQEARLRSLLGKDVSVLRDRRRDSTRPLTMREFRERVERGYVPKERCHGCNCMLPV